MEGGPGRNKVKQRQAGMFAKNTMVSCILNRMLGKRWE